MESIKAFLAHHHYLNHPHLSALSAFVCLAAGIFVWWKNKKAASCRAFLYMTAALFVWFFGNAMSMIHHRDIGLSLLWYRIGYTSVPFLAPAFFHFYLTYFCRKSRTMPFLLFLAFAEVILLWFSDLPARGAYALRNVGIIWKGMTVFSWILAFSMVRYFITVLLCTVGYIREMRREKVLLRKKQLRNFAWIYGFLLMGWTEWIVCFNIPLHVAWLLVPIFIIQFGYAIIHFKALEIDTVVHKTILWLATLILLVIPAGLVNLLLHEGLAFSGRSLRITVFSIYLVFFVLYYNRLRPWIDHLFRRRRYDYQTIIGKIAERIATSLSIEELTSRLLKELCEVMYLRNDIFYVLSKDQSSFLLMGRGNSSSGGSCSGLEVYDQENRRKLDSSERELRTENSFVRYLLETMSVLEKEQVEADPEYVSFRETALAWFNRNRIEVVIPVIYQNQVNALLGLGKKENLTAYRRKDLELLKKLSQEIGVTVFNVLHFEDLAEKERLEQELRMGREIQMSLLPLKAPKVEHLSLQGMTVPAREIGGDYYDFISLPRENDLAIIIGDVSGKGVAAGLCMAMVKTSVHIFARREASPKQILVHINQVLNQQLGGEKFMTMLYLIWNAESSIIRYSSAGHEHILLFRKATGGIDVIQSGGTILGVIDDIDTFLEEKSISLLPGDKILLYTDGVTEAHNAVRDRFGLDRLRMAFQKHSQKDSHSLIQAVKGEVSEFIGSSLQYDDITLVALEAR